MHTTSKQVAKVTEQNIYIDLPIHRCLQIIDHETK